METLVSENEFNERKETIEPVPSSFRRRPGLIPTLAFLFGLILVSGVVALLLQSSSQQKKNSIPPTSSVSKPTNNTIIYGYWSGRTSFIHAYDMSNKKDVILAELPFDIKHVKVIDPLHISYIKNTNEKDYGTELVIRILDTKKEEVIYTTSNGFGIDDYVVSPGGNYVSIWELKTAEDSELLSGGRSRVVNVNVKNPKEKYVLYDEPTIEPVHYPVGVTQDGDVFTDKFLANSGAGWAYGMGVSNFNGTKKEDLENMKNGTYGTQPVLSQDGTKFAFAGYDGTKGDGMQLNNGFRIALLNANTVEIFDTNLRTRMSIKNSFDSTFLNAYWDLQTGDLMYAMISKDANESGLYSYNLPYKESKKLDTGSNFSDSLERAYAVISILSDGTYLVSENDLNPDSAGNLGSKYGQNIVALYKFDSNSTTQEKINVTGLGIQFIGLAKQSYFSDKIGIDVKKSSKDNLQLNTFTIKPYLESKRSTQQSDVPTWPLQSCSGISVQQCNSKYNTNYSHREAMRRRLSNNPDYRTPFDRCFVQTWSSLGMKGKCNDSPLYLYGPKGLKVKVIPETSIFSSNVPYYEKGFDILHNGDGTFIANRQKVESLTFDYIAGIKINRPTRGTVVEKEKVIDIVKDYAVKLGLNEKETSDTISSIQSSVASKYAFISFYDDVTSRKILPLYFDPVPDNYRNIVFYVENLNELPSISYALPEFEKITRGGFTAVEISFIVK